MRGGRPVPLSIVMKGESIGLHGVAKAGGAPQPELEVCEGKAGAAQWGRERSVAVDVAGSKRISIGELDRADAGRRRCPGRFPPGLKWHRSRHRFPINRRCRQRWRKRRHRPRGTQSWNRSGRPLRGAVQTRTDRHCCTASDKPPVRSTGWTNPLESGLDSAFGSWRSACARAPPPATWSSPSGYPAPG